MRRMCCCVVLLILSNMLGTATHPRTASDRGVLRYTRHLPAIDKVELEKFNTREIWIESIAASKVIEGQEAQAIATLWRTQNYRAASAICHYPAYGMKFYARGRVVLYASICWQCDNIEFMIPGLKSRLGFAGGSRKGQALLEVFRKAFSQKE